MSKKQKKWYLTGWGVVAILCFWPIILSYYLIKFVVRRSRETTPHSTEQPSVMIDVDDETGSYPMGMRTVPKNANYAAKVKTHCARLVEFYKQYAARFEKNQDPKLAIIKQVHKDANPHMCPYCGVIHDFTASRARKCPDCGKQMVVRSGVFLTNQQAEDVDKKISEFYDKSYVADHLKHGIGEIQDYALRGDYGQAFLRIAEAYQQCAIIHNVKYDKGYSNWDFSWQILNKEALDYATSGSANDAKSIVENGYTDVLFARGKHALQQMKYSETSASHNKYAYIAAQMFYMYLVELAGAKLDDWQRDDAIKWIALVRTYGNLREDQLDEIEAKLGEHTVTKANQQAIDSITKEVHDYVFLETNQDRIRDMIY